MEYTNRQVTHTTLYNNIQIDRKHTQQLTSDKSYNHKTRTHLNNKHSEWLCLLELTMLYSY